MSPNERLREHPEGRLAAPVQLVTLAAAAARLRAEPHPSVTGHRQITIVRHGPVTLVLFVFDTDGLLKEHRAEGIVTIHVLDGRLQVMADGETHELEAGALLALAPGIPHAVRAATASEMLLTVHRLPTDTGNG